MVEKNINFNSNENFYTIGERPQNEIEKMNKVYEALRTLQEYCENCEKCENCGIYNKCCLPPSSWERLNKN